MNNTFSKEDRIKNREDEMGIHPHTYQNFIENLIDFLLGEKRNELSSLILHKEN